LAEYGKSRARLDDDRNDGFIGRRQYYGRKIVE
jgi:hypothetical protein